MPNAILAWLDQRGWGRYHLEWHVVRRWDVFPQAVRDWAIGQGWGRAAVQEGEPSNGLAFLAMHRVMIRQLPSLFAQHSALFVGWATPPTDPHDLQDPLPNGGTQAFDPDMAAAVGRLHTQLTAFASDDELGLYVETSMRPEPGEPDKLSTDPTAGIHNYLHGRFTDKNSQANMGDPERNLGNRRFWRLHGWIDSRWTAFRQLTGRADAEAEYVAALQEAESHMSHASHPHAALASTEGASQARPPELSRLFTLVPIASGGRR